MSITGQNFTGNYLMLAGGLIIILATLMTPMQESILGQTDEFNWGREINGENGSGDLTDASNAHFLLYLAAVLAILGGIAPWVNSLKENKKNLSKVAIVGGLIGFYAFYLIYSLVSDLNGIVISEPFAIATGGWLALIGSILVVIGVVLSFRDTEKTHADYREIARQQAKAKRIFAF